MTNLNKEINRSFVFNFAATASKEDAEWILERTRYWQDKMGKVRYFSPSARSLSTSSSRRRERPPRRSPLFLKSWKPSLSRLRKKGC